MKIRKAHPSDEAFIRQIYLEAFEADESESVADLACQLLHEGSKPEIVSLVAEEQNKLLGHIACSPIFRNDDKSLTGYILAPLAVTPEKQQKGIGRKLIEFGIEESKHLGATTILVYGDPNYYSQFGFDVEVAKHFIPEYELKYSTAWLGIDFCDDSRSGMPVPFTCVDPLNKPELW